MKHNYDFKFNQPKVTDESIEQFKDFEKLMADFEETTVLVLPTTTQRPVRRMWWPVAAMAATVCGAMFYFFWNNTGSDFDTVQKDYFAKQEFVNPPLKGLEEEISTAKLVAEKGGEFSSKTGSKYTVEPNSLKNKDGQPVSGEVTIKYREMHDYVDFFVSGIPMTYDSAGTTYQLESAGMVEIYAEQDGEKLEINPNKPIQVELISEIPLLASQEVPEFNIYQLDIENRNWKFRNVDNIQLVERDLPANKNKNQQLADLDRAKVKELAQLERRVVIFYHLKQ